MEERKRKGGGHSGNEEMSRRAFLKMAGAAGGFLTISGFPGGDLMAQQTQIELEDPAYNKLYNDRKGFYMQDPKWVEQSLPRLQWPKAGERIPVLEVLHTPVDFPFWTDFMRKVSSDAQQLGLKYELRAVSRARRLDDINKHVHGDIELHTAIMRPERIGPSEWLTSRAYGFDRRNYGEWANRQYDEWVDLQDTETEFKKKLDYVQKAQKILAEDLYIGQFGWGPSIVEAFNKEQWDGVVQSKGFGIASSNMFWSYVKMQPKTSRKRLVVGVKSLLETTNLLGATHFFRSVGRMIYDRLAYYDKDLNVIPWAAESWKKVDNRTWDVKLRGGMKFHDGKPVTVDDLQFTFDFMLKYERGIFYTANMNLASTEIVDRPNRTVRFRFKEPYGEFETFFLLLNVLLPKHIFEGIMEKQGVGDDPRRLRIAQPIGSGPFKFGPHKKDTDLLLIANKEHFSTPKIDELLYVVVPSIDGIMGRLETQEIDMAEEVFLAPSQAKQLSKSKHLAMVRTPDINWFHGVLTISRLPWRDFEFRRAWQHSLDREFLVKVCWEGEGRVPASNTFFVDTNPWHNPNLPSVPKYDLKLARQILKDAGYSWDGEGRLIYPPPGDKKFIERVNRVCKVGYKWGGLKMLSRK